MGRRAIHRLRIEVPGAADVPPPAHAAIVHFVAPPSALPGQMAVIGVTAKVSLRKIPVHDMGTLRSLRSVHLPDAGGRRPALLPLRRWLVLLLLRLRRERKSSHDRYQRNGDPRAFEGTHGLVSPLLREPVLWISRTSKSKI